MERIDRDRGRPDRAELKAERVFLFDMHGGVFEVVCDRASDRKAAPRAEPEEGLPPRVIRSWLAGAALGLLGLGFLAEPGAAVEQLAPPAVDRQSW
jgi:hypothetical protein